MTSVQITNGMIKYGQTVKTGDFENKRGDVELSFNIPDGQDPDEAYELVTAKAHTYLGLILNGPAGAKPAASAEKPKPARAPKIPAAEKATAKDASAVEEPGAEKEVDASAVEEPEQKVPNFLTGKNKKAAAAADAAVVDDNDLGDILGTGEPAKDITDKELTDATNKVQAACKNAPAIRKIFTDILAKSGIKVPPGRIIDIPQVSRQEYIDKLAEVKPLA